MKKNMIGIIGAMEEEVAKLKDYLKDTALYQKAGMDFYTGHLHNTEVVIVRSGIGKVNAAVCAQILVDKFNVSHLINTGIAGSLDARIDIGDIVLSTFTLHHDMDAQGFGYEIGQIPRLDVFSFAADKDLIELAKACCESLKLDINIHTGVILSGDQFICDSEKKTWLKQTFDGMCVEMEGAAIAQTAYLNQIPYLVIRAISDKADASANMDYQDFEAQAIKTSVSLVKEMMTRLD